MKGPFFVAGTGLVAVRLRQWRAINMPSSRACMVMKEGKSYGSEKERVPLEVVTVTAHADGHCTMYYLSLSLLPRHLGLLPYFVPHEDHLLLSGYWCSLWMGANV